MADIQFRQQAVTRPQSYSPYETDTLDDVSSGMNGPSPGSSNGSNGASNSNGFGGSETAFAEVEGDPISKMPAVEAGEMTELTPEAAHQEVGVDATESGEEYTEASPEQLAIAASSAEAGEESALSDLREFAGFVAPEFSAEGAVLQEVGAAAEGGNQEFLPVLAALVPTLVSTVGPMVAKAISGRLSKRAKAAVVRVANIPRPPTPPRAPGAAPSPAGLGSFANLLPILARLLQQQAGKESAGMEGMEGIDESFVTEAAAAMEVIIGVDQRIRITPTTDIPWRRICALRITFPSGSTYRGTGFFVGPRAVATAGHCVYLKNQGGWARKIEVIPGSDGAKRPFGSAETSVFRSVGGWVSSQLPECDYGCIFLPTGAFAGKNLGHFGAAAFDPAVLVAQPAVVAGYHGDKPFAELWGMAEVIKTVTAKTLTYNIDTMGGCSGAPVYIKRNGVRYVVGIHNYGGATGNSATRITLPVYQRLLAWSKM